MPRWTHKLSLDDCTKFLVLICQRVLNKELIENGNIPVYSANVFEPFGYVNKLLIQDFSVDSVLWGIDGDWLVSLCPRIIPSIRPTIVESFVVRRIK